MINLMTKLCSDATQAVVASQALLTILSAFCGGFAQSWRQTPVYWLWLREFSIFTQSSRAELLAVADHLKYSCTLFYGICAGKLGEIYSCDDDTHSTSTCTVSGRDLLQVQEAVSTSLSYWEPLGYLVLLLAVFRLGGLLLMYFPGDRMALTLKRMSLMYSDRWSKVLTPKPFIKVKSCENFNLDRYDRQRKDNHSLLYADDANADRTSMYLITNLTKKGIQSFTWSRVTVTLKHRKQKTLIDNVSGFAWPGRVLALMGPSGAGKTTLLNALGNRAPYAHTSGTVRFGPNAVTPADLMYVPQFDELNGNLTVREQVELVGMLKCFDADGMQKRLFELLKILNLETSAYKKCSTLSGGELKRVRFAMGVISKPRVLFLDEPTTGVDSSGAFAIVSYLTQLAIKTDIAVIMTIHQPSEMVFELLEDLLILENGGRVAYFGERNGCQKYFSSIGFSCPDDMNPADLYLDLVYAPPPHSSNPDVTTWQDIFVKSPYYETVSRTQEALIEYSALEKDHPSSVKMTRSCPSEAVRIQHLFFFFVKYYSRDGGFYIWRTFFLVILAVILGSLYLLLTPNTDNIPQYSGVVFCNIWIVIISAIGSTGLLAVDRRIFLEQVKNGLYHPASYCIAQFLASLPFNLLASLLFQAVYHWLTNINPHTMPFIYSILITCGHMLMMEAAMFMIVAIFRNAMLSVTFSIIVVAVLLLFTGFFVRVVDIPVWVRWICYIIPTRVSHSLKRTSCSILILTSFIGTV